jgi:hypothetical protein
MKLKFYNCKQFTIRFHSFTNGNIPSVCDSTFLGNFFTDNIPDGKRASTFLSSVIPNFVAKSVGKKKTFADGFIDGNCAPKKIFPLEIYR